MTCTRIGHMIVCGRPSTGRRTGGGRRRPPREKLPCRQPGGCDRGASQASWGCKPHWFKLPQHLRDNLWRADRDERAATGRLGPAWAAAAAEAEAWILEQQSKPKRPSWRQGELPL